MSTTFSGRRGSLGLQEPSTEGERRWKNPNEVVRLRRKLTRKPSLKSTGKPRDALKLSRNENSRTPVCKRTSENFTDSPTPPKRLRGGLQDISNSPIALGSPGKSTIDSWQAQKVKLAPLLAEQRLPTVTDTPSVTDDAVPQDATLPLDWALKTKVRFVSPFPFSWSQSVKPHHEAGGVTQFVTNSQPKRGCDNQTRLHSGLMLWSHPSLPFINTFPRCEGRQKNTQTPALLGDKETLQALRDDWSTSLCSVYQLLKCGHCPYFYVCANQFTVLFTMSADARGSPCLSAMITPTTSGMRESLKKEGAELHLPLAPSTQPGSDEECSDGEDDGAATSWLTTMGLPSHHLPAIQPQKLTNEVRIDNHPESAVLLQGARNVHILFNFILTSKTTITTTGSHAGVPPTILSPTGFRGATLKTLKMKQGSFQELDEGRMVQRFHLEVMGPVLPRSLHTLACLFRKTQHGQFTAHMSNVEATGAFNGGTEQANESSSEELAEPNLHTKPLSQKHGLRELVCETYDFTWL